MNRPNWYTDETDSSWDRVKAAFRNDWEQTKHDFGSDRARDLGQDVDNTVKQAAGTEDPFDKHEKAFRFGFGAQREFKTKYPTWNNDLDTRLRQDYGPDYDTDRNYIRHAYEYRYSGGNAAAGTQREERRP